LIATAECPISSVGLYGKLLRGSLNLAALIAAKAVLPRKVLLLEQQMAAFHTQILQSQRAETVRG
jgi:hypothetical protein